MPLEYGSRGASEGDEPVDSSFLKITCDFMVSYAIALSSISQSNING